MTHQRANPRHLFDQQYDRPTQIRKIPRKYSSNRGRFYSTKSHLYYNGTAHQLESESTLERDLYYLLDHDPNCHDFVSQPKIIKWKDSVGKGRTAFPDTWAIFVDGQEGLFQVKRKQALEQLENDPLWLEECQAIQKYCKNKNWFFKIVTDEEIRTPRLGNVKYLRFNHEFEESIETIVEVKLKLKSILKNGAKLSKKELTTKLSKGLNIPSEDSQMAIEYLMNKDFFFFDWYKTVSDSTQLRIRVKTDGGIEPVYQIKPIEKAPTAPPTISLENDLDVDYRTWNLIPKAEREIAEKRYEMIRPLIEKKSEGNLTKEDVEKRKDEVGGCTATLYNYLKQFDNDGKKGLLPRTRYKGNRTPQTTREAEDLMKKVIGKHYFARMSRISQRRCYDIFVEYCDEHGLIPASFVTFRKRITEFPRTEIRGSQNDGHRNGIPMRLTGKGTPPTKRSLEMVYVDHTKINVVIVDQVYKKPIGRPNLTIAIDAYSRIIYGYHLSLENISSMSVGSALIRGILPKDEVVEEYGGEFKSPWEIFGFPQMLKWDNGKDFDSKAVQRFCSIYSINHDFSPVKRPESNGIVERFFGRIKAKILDEELPGYTLRPSDKPSGYNPDKTAALTLPDLEKWLVRFIIEYHNSPHSSLLEKSPREKYLDGLKGFRPRLPKDPSRLWFDILPNEERELQPYGIRCNDLTYNSRKLGDARIKMNGNKTVNICADKRDIRYIHWFDEETEKYLHVPLAGAPETGLVPGIIDEAGEIPPISLEEFKKIKNRLKREGKRVSPYNILQARKERIKRMRGAAKKNQADRKAMEKIESGVVFANRDIDEVESDLAEEWDEEIVPSRAIKKDDEIDTEINEEWDEEIVPGRAIRWGKKEDVGVISDGSGSE